MDLQNKNSLDEGNSKERPTKAIYALKVTAALILVDVCCLDDARLNTAIES